MIEQLLSSIEPGLIYGIVAIGIYLTFRIINFADLTVDGSFTLGAAVTTILIINGYNPWISLVAATFSGMCTGCITSCLYIKYKITDLLSGILVMTSLYSINLMIMGAPNLSIIDKPTIFINDNNPTFLLDILGNYYPLFLLTSLTIIVILKFMFFTNSELGLEIKAAGTNPKASRLYGINVDARKTLAIVISNAIVAFAGSLMAQINGFVDVSMGTGTIIVGIAAIIIGETITSHISNKTHVIILGCILGSIIYRLAIVVALNLEFIKSYHLNLVTAILITTIIVAPRILKGENK